MQCLSFWQRDVMPASGCAWKLDVHGLCIMIQEDSQSLLAGVALQSMCNRAVLCACAAVSTHKRASRLEICREKKRNRSSVGGVKIRYHMRQITAHMRPRLRVRSSIMSLLALLQLGLLPA